VLGRRAGSPKVLRKSESDFEDVPDDVGGRDPMLGARVSRELTNKTYG